MIRISLLLLFFPLVSLSQSRLSDGTKTGADYGQIGIITKKFGIRDERTPAIFPNGITRETADLFYKYTPPNGLYRFFIHPDSTVGVIDWNGNEIIRLANGFNPDGTLITPEIDFSTDITSISTISGRYRIGVDLNQPYLVNSQGNRVKILVENEFVNSWSSGNSLQIDVRDDVAEFNRQHLAYTDGRTSLHINILRDSVSVGLPNYDEDNDSIPRDGDFNAIYAIRLSYFGVNGNFQTFDETRRIDFESQVRWTDRQGIQYQSNYMSHDHVIDGFKIPKSFYTFSLLWQYPTSTSDGYWYLSH